MNNSVKIMKDMAKLHANFKLRASGLSGIFKINDQFGLKADADIDSNEWKVFDALSGDQISWREIQKTFIPVVQDFINEYEQMKAGEQKDPLDTLKEHGFEDAPSIPDATGEKLAEMDRLENEKAEAGEIKIQQMEKREKVKEMNSTKEAWKTPAKKQEIQDANFEEVGPQEVVNLPAPVGIGIVRPAVTAQQALAAWREFQDLKRFIIEGSDTQIIQGKKFVKKSGWRKFATVYNLTDLIVEEKQVQLENGGYYWKIKVMCTAPNGRQTEGVGICASTERKFAHPEHDIYATAHTRSKNRAISDMIAAGEVSAEEVE